MELSNVRLLVQAVVVTVVLVVVVVWTIRAFILVWFQSPSPLGKMVQTMNRLSDRVDKLERDRERDHETIMQLRVQVEEWMIYARLLAAKLREFGEEVPPAPKREVSTAEPDDRLLVSSIAALFNRDEIDDLAFRLGINTEEINGESAGKRARALVGYARRHGMAEELIALAARLRPEGRFL